MSRRVSFKLYSKDAAGNPIDEERLALAFQHHCHKNLGINMDLNMIVKHVFLKYLNDAVDKKASDKQDLAAAGLATKEITSGEVPQEQAEPSSSGEQGVTHGLSQGDAGVNVEAPVRESGSTAGDAVAISEAVPGETAAAPG